MKKKLQHTILSNFLHSPTKGQLEAIDKISNFVADKENKSLFVLKGYAGTGKTSLLGALVKSLPEVKCKSVLMAPTGRAAKVLAAHSKKEASTIHKKIYVPVANAFGGKEFVLTQNLYTNTIFIVDESSMIGDGSGYDDKNLFGNRSLLEDLIQFVYSGINCKLMLIGDTAQLPPVKLSVSPGLDIEYLSASFTQEVENMELTEVVRQEKESGILFNATELRQQINSGLVQKPSFKLNGFADIINVNGSDLLDLLNDSYSKYSTDDTMVICRTNKRANIYNQQIRSRIRWQEDEISVGDYLMVVKNNYFWLPDESSAGFIANGDIVEIKKIKRRKELHGFSFADVTIKMLDYPNEPEFETKIMLNTLSSESPSLSYEEGNKLYQSVNEDYISEKSKAKRWQKVKNDPFFNALQVKFGYAITCHKAQGGQWKSVFIEQGYLTDEMINIDFMRWLYTALTRATEKVHLINFNKDFFNEN